MQMQTTLKSPKQTQTQTQTHRIRIQTHSHCNRSLQCFQITHSNTSALSHNSRKISLFFRFENYHFSALNCIVNINWNNINHRTRRVCASAVCNPPSIICYFHRRKTNRKRFEFCHSFDLKFKNQSNPITQFLCLTNQPSNNICHKTATKHSQIRSKRWDCVCATIHTTLQNPFGCTIATMTIFSHFMKRLQFGMIT